jgi:16S rRNA (guanine527-N7)-methyltransferase
MRVGLDTGSVSRETSREGLKIVPRETLPVDSDHESLRDWSRMKALEESEALRITAGATAMGTTLAAEAAARMARHVSLVYEENERCNLTGIPRAHATELHVLDSLSGLGPMNESPEGDWLDLGSGAGFPGVTLAIASGRRVDLLESIGKKARFLELVQRELCLDGTVLGQRAEVAALQRRGCYAAVSARAVSELPALVELAAPLLAAGGLLICWKGEPEETELVRGAAVARLVGMKHRSTSAVRVPGSDARRCLVVYQRVGRSTMALPRRVGLAQSRPLA